MIRKAKFEDGKMKVAVVPYDPHWAEAYATERVALATSLGDVLVQTHHIGSTAVKDLAAKPIIDILLEVTSLELLDQRNNPLAEMGYEAMGEYGIPGRRYFRKGGDNRTHQLHAFLSGDSHVLRHLAFRDYLAENRSVAWEYGRLKTELAQKYPEDIEAYCDGKTPARLRSIATSALRFMRMVRTAEPAGSPQSEQIWNQNWPGN